MYRPAIQSAKIASVFAVGPYTATLLTEIESPSLIRYGYVMQFTDPQGHPCFYAATEENELAAQLGGGSHFLCSYFGGEHRNHGSSNDWTDLQRFTAEALRLFHQQFP